MKILLTGGQGFIGRNIQEQFADRWPSHTLVSLDKKPKADLNHDLLKYLEWAPDQPVDAIFHLAAASGVRETAVHNQVAYNLTIVKQLCNWATRRGVKTIVHASSSSVYGDTVLMDESRPVAPISKYAKSKVVCEKYLDEWALSNDAVVVHLRLFNNIGKHQRPNMFPYLVADNIVNKAQLELLGNRTRGWTYVGDTVRAFEATLSMFHGSKGGSSYTFNVGTGQSYSQLELIDMFERAANRKSSWTQVEGHTADVQSTRAETSRFESVFGWRPLTTNIIHGVNEVLTQVSSR